MELTVHPLLTLVDDNANGLKLLLKNYIDFTVEQQFDQLKNSIVEMIATGQIGPQSNESSLAYSQNTFSTDQSNIDTPNSSIVHHANDELTFQSSSLVGTITTSAVIKQECLEDSSTTIPINVHCNDAPNDIYNDQSNNAEISLNDGQNAPVPIDEVKEEYDDDEDDDEGEYMPESDECEDCVNGICQLNQCHLVRENDNTNNDAPSVTENDNLENNGIYSSVQGRDSQNEFAEEDVDDGIEDPLLPIGQQNNDLSNASIVPPTIYHENDQLTTDQITLPPTNQHRTSTKQTNNNLTNHNEIEDFEDCLNGIKDEKEYGNDETGEQIGIDQGDELHRLDEMQSFDSTQTLNGQSQANGQSPIQTKQVNSQIECDEPVIQQSIPSTSGLRSSNRKRIPTKLFGDDQSNQVKSDKRKSTNQSSKAVKKVKHQDVDEIDQKDDEVEGKTKLQIITVEVNCTEPGCNNSILKSRALWKQHYSKIHGFTPFKEFENNYRYNQHGQTEYPCNECERVSTSQYSLYKHWKSYHLPGKFECSVCGFVARFEQDARNHYTADHSPSKHPCTYPGCKQVFKDNHILERHKRVHNDERPYKCTWSKCQLSFKQVGTAIRHVRVQHFHLPPTVIEQQELNIIDTRDPKVFVQVCQG